MYEILIIKLKTIIKISLKIYIKYILIKCNNLSFKFSQDLIKYFAHNDTLNSPIGNYQQNGRGTWNEGAA